MNRLPVSLLLLLILGCVAAQPVWADDNDTFSPDLGQPLEVIDGGRALDVTIPANAPERTAYPLPPYYQAPLLTQVPGKPFRQVDPPPQWPAFWKYPFYAALGFPRDVVDSAFGGLRFIPLINCVTYAGYEVVPTQALMRDPRDWHRWDGRQNHNEHGAYDGSYWGFFPSWHEWSFTYPSKWAARRNARKNEELQAQLSLMNREIEARNFKESESLREARRKALEAIEQLNGAEAVKRMLPARAAYPQDEGIFALYVAALAEYADQQGPDWTLPVLWHELAAAQPRPLAAAQELIAKTADKHPNAITLGKARIYALTLQGNNSAAFDAAKKLAGERRGDAQLDRLALEAALSAEKLAEAEALGKAVMTGAGDDRELLETRLKLANGEAEAAKRALEPLQAAHPENAYYNYCLGIAEMMNAEKQQKAAEFNKAFTHIEQAALQAPNTALRLRAGQALSYLRGVQASIKKNPELFAGAPAEEK